MMPGTVGMHDRDKRARTRLLDHERKMMSVVARQGRPQDDQVESGLLKRLLHALAANHHLHVIAGLLQQCGFGGQNLLVPFAIKDLRFRHSGPLSYQTLATAWRLENVTEGHARGCSFSKNGSKPTRRC